MDHSHGFLTTVSFAEVYHASFGAVLTDDLSSLNFGVSAAVDSEFVCVLVVVQLRFFDEKMDLVIDSAVCGEVLGESVTAVVYSHVQSVDDLLNKWLSLIFV